MGYAGEIYVVNGMNEQAGSTWSSTTACRPGALWYDSRVPSVAALFQFLLDGASGRDRELFPDNKVEFCVHNRV